jgi:holo-[acyl-carrier protein] synthase
MAEVGVDIVEIARVRAAVQRHTSGFRRRVYTATEWQQCGASYASLAGRFAAKEAVMKALGVGGMKFRDIEIVRTASGKPEVRLAGRMLRRAQRLGLDVIKVTISHSQDNAVAVALAERSDATATAPLVSGAGEVAERNPGPM